MTARRVANQTKMQIYAVHTSQQHALFLLH